MRGKIREKIICCILCFVLAVGMLTGCESSSNLPVDGELDNDAAKGSNDHTINLWSFTNEVPGMVKVYLKKYHPDYKVRTTIIPTMDGAYQSALDDALNNSKNFPDIYTVEAAFVKNYTQGDESVYALPYEDLGIPVKSMIKKSQIASYSVDVGTGINGKVVGLGYQSTGGCCIYRRSIAKKVFGTDDPKVISKVIGPGKEKFMQAAEKLKQNGYAIVSEDGELWHPIENSSKTSWINDKGELHIDPEREAFLDVSKQLKQNGYENGTIDWKDDWYKDMSGEGKKEVFGFFGPAWLINYAMISNCGGTKKGEGTYGDWAITDSPIPFFWGGTWILANRKVKKESAEKKKVIADILKWITLDSSKTGLQYQWANGTFYGKKGIKDCVASMKVMKELDGSLDFLDGQNMYDYFVPANKNANGKNLTQYDEKIDQIWRKQVREYAYGRKTRKEAIHDFKYAVKNNLDIIPEKEPSSNKKGKNKK